MGWPTSATSGGFRPPGTLCKAQHITCSAPLHVGCRVPSPAVGTGRTPTFGTASMSRRIRKSEAYHSNLAPIRRTRLKEVGSSNFGPHEGGHWIASVVFRRTRREVVPKSVWGKFHHIDALVFTKTGSFSRGRRSGGYHAGACWELRSADTLARVATGGFTLRPNWRDSARLTRLKHHSND
jgi:hypothetical protein